MARRSSPRVPLPAPFDAEPFSVSAARAAGLSRNRLRGRDLEAPFRAVRRRSGSPTDVASQCRAYLHRMVPGAYFCSATAARLWGIPLPTRLERSIDVHVGVVAPQRAPRGVGVRGHTFALRAGDLGRHRGFPVTTPARTWRDLAPLLTLRELVAAGDAILRGDRPLATLDQLVRAADVGARRRGAARLAAALTLLDGRAASPRESHLRVLLVQAGFGGFEVNHKVTLPGMRGYYVIDLAFPAERVAVEYQGAYHHDEDQWRADMTRMSRLRAHGWNVIEVHTRDLDDPRELVVRIRAALAHARR